MRVDGCGLWAVSPGLYFYEATGLASQGSYFSVLESQMGLLPLVPVPFFASNWLPKWQPTLTTTQGS